MSQVINRREFLKIATLATGGAVLAACAPPTPTPEPAAPAKPEPTKPSATAKPEPKEMVEIRMHVRTGSEADTLADLLPPFEEEKNIKVKVESFPGGEYYEKLQILLAGGTAGDVWWGVVYTGQGLQHAANEIVLFLDDLVKAEDFDLSQYYDPAITGCSYEGKLFGLPFKLHPGVVGLYYNADLFAEAGLDEPKPQTHEELAEIARNLTKTEGGRTTQWGFLPPYTTTPHFFHRSTRAWGSDTMSKDGTKALMNTEESKESMRFNYDLAFKSKVAPSLSEIPEQAFVSGVLAMLQSGSWDKSLPTRIKDFVVKDVLMPRGPSGKLGTWIVTDFIGINAKTQHQQESWELVKMTCGKEFGIRLGEGQGGASGTSGGRKDVFESERLMSNPLHPIWRDAVSLEEEGNEMVIPANFRGDEYRKTLTANMDPLWIGDAEPDDAFFEDVNQALQTVLDKPAP